MLVIGVIFDAGVVLWPYASDQTGAWAAQVPCKPQSSVPSTVGLHCGITVTVTVRSG